MMNSESAVILGWWRLAAMGVMTILAIAMLALAELLVKDGAGAEAGPALSVTNAPTGPALAGNLPDLVADSMSIRLEGGGGCTDDSKLGVEVIFSNIGATDSGAFDVTVNGATQRVDAGLLHGQAMSLWFNGFVQGDNMLEVDSGSEVAESNEENNSLTEQPAVPTPPPTCIPTPVGGLLPDLVANGMHIGPESGTDCSGKNLGILASVYNAGQGASGPFDVTVNGATQRIEKGMEPGPLSLTNLWFSGYEVGDNSLVVDSSSEIVESDELNNTLIKDPFVSSTPILVPTCTPTNAPVPPNTPVPSDTPEPTDTPVPGGLIGDVGCSGEVNAIDAAFLLQLVAGLISELPCQENADVNEDGNVDAIDATLVLQFSAGLLGTLPP